MINIPICMPKISPMNIKILNKLLIRVIINSPVDKPSHIKLRALPLDL